MLGRIVGATVGDTVGGDPNDPNAYTLQSFDATYNTPFDPITADENTAPPVPYDHNSDPAPLTA
jgi:hypothetical protein